ncbi:MAG TPA: CPBP family intramembrane glutamic endopeptidase [Pyrinomonadaceae bacterium]
MLDLIVSVAVVTLFGGIGEEIGWRGYLLPQLLELGALRAALICGLLHGLWHLPVMIWTPFYHGAGNQWIVIPLFLATLTLAGICYGYLRLTTASIWPPALAHSAFNIVWERFNLFTDSAAPLAIEYLAGECGVLTLIALALPAAWFGRRLSLMSGEPTNAKTGNRAH